MNHLIVGIDCGKTSAIACLDLDGRIVRMAHKRFAGEGWIISELSRTGIPSVIATDRKIPGRAIKRINAAFNARLFYPESDMTTEEKMRLVKDKGIQNRHEQDAYSAAIKAYNSYSNKLKQVSHIVGPGADAEGIKAKVIRKFSVREAILNKNPNRR